MIIPVDKITFILFFNGPPLGVAVYGKALLKRLVPLIEKNNISVEIYCSTDAFTFLITEEILAKYCHEIKCLNSFCLRSAYLLTRQMLSMSSDKAVEVLLTNPVVSPVKSSWSPRVLSVIHDLNEFRANSKYGLLRSWVRRFLLRVSMKYSDQIVCISDSVMAQYVSLNTKMPNTACVINNGAGNDLDIIERNPTKQILIVGRIDPQGKNLYQSLQVINKWLNEDDKLKIVFVGGVNVSSKAEAEKFLDTVLRDERIVYLGRVDDKQLSELYAQSEFLLFLSILEGFGMPPFEALRAGCPVVAHMQNNVLKELLNNSVIYVDPSVSIPTIFEIRNKIEKEKNESGLTKTSLYTWDKAADEYFKLIMSLQ